jgi:hypothetical protein
MNDLSDKRRKILSSLITSDFSLADVARMFGKPDRQIKDMITEPPRKPFGDKVARAMENYAIINGHQNIYPYFFDGFKKNSESAPVAKLKISGVEIDTYEQQLLKVFASLSTGHKDAVLLLANKLLEIDRPNDLKANPTNGKKKKEHLEQ